MDTRKHIKESERLNQALGGRLPEVQKDLKEIMIKYNLNAMPELAFDVSRYVIEELHTERINSSNVLTVIAEKQDREVGMDAKKYVSERIVNISDLEEKLKKAQFITLSALEELKKNSPSIINIKELLEEDLEILSESIGFEFEIERRTTTDVFEHQQDKEEEGIIEFCYKECSPVC